MFSTRGWISGRVWVELLPFSLSCPCQSYQLWSSFNSPILVAPFWWLVSTLVTNFGRMKLSSQSFDLTFSYLAIPAPNPLYTWALSTTWTKSKAPDSCHHLYYLSIGFTNLYEEGEYSRDVLGSPVNSLWYKWLSYVHTACRNFFLFLILRWKPTSCLHLPW